MDIVVDISDGLLLILSINLAILIYLALKGRKLMSASSNLKDAVAMLDNSAAALNDAIGNHVAVIAALTPDADVQAAADKINAVAVAIGDAAAKLAAK